MLDFSKATATITGQRECDRVGPRGGGTYWAEARSWRRADRLWCVDFVLLFPGTTPTDGSYGQRCRNDGNCGIFQI